MKYYLILDTNVIVSTLLDKDDNSAISKVMNMVFTKEVKLLYSDCILDEYKEVLSRPDFSFSKVNIGNLINYIKKMGILLTPNKLNELLKDPSDMPFYELVMSTRDKDSKLITGNKKHFPNKTFILKPREFLDFIK